MNSEALFISICAFFLGACVGSFLNACIYRLPRDISVVVPRSYCTNCGSFIPWHHNFPLISWWWLRGNAPCCGAKFSMRYFWIELLTAVMFALWVSFFGLWIGLAYSLFFSFMIVAFFTDVDFMIIPDSVNFGAAMCAVALSMVLPELHSSNTWSGALTSSALGALVGSAALFIIARVGKFVLKKEAMGLGDVKLMLAIGAMMGWEGALFTIGAGALVGTVMGLFVIVVQGKKLGSGVAIPFGPALIVAASFWPVWGRTWWHEYFSVFSSLPNEDYLQW